MEARADEPRVGGCQVDTIEEFAGGKQFWIA